MQRWMASFSRFGRDESGQDLIEYALIAALIALTTIAAMGSLASSIAGAFSSTGSQLDSAIPSS